jgi:DNA-binding NtrC family response regulator
MVRTATMDRADGRPNDVATWPGLLLLCAKDRRLVPNVFALRDAQVVLGREPPAGGCAIPQTAVSRQHARIVRQRQGETWHIEDLGSRNGTFVDGRRVERAELRHGMAIRIGDTLFQFVQDQIDEYLPYGLLGEVGGNRSPVPELVGGMQMARVAEQIAAAAAAQLTVLVLGETGTGKEVASRALHRLSGRGGPFSAVNCAAIPSHLVESELFGYRKAAFTGADRDKPGILQAAAGGTVLLDEIGDMPLDAQAKLLRVIELREVMPLGSVRAEALDVRFVCATHQDLPALVAAGRFRGDLYARISALTVTLPALRDRKEDLYALVTHFLKLAGRSDLDPSFPFMLGVCDYEWPHNVRELAAVVARAVTVADEPSLQVRHLPPALQARMASYGSREAPGAAANMSPERGVPTTDALRQLLAKHAGNVAAVARDLRRDRAQVHRLIRRLGLVPDEFRPRGG